MWTTLHTLRVTYRQATSLATRTSRMIPDGDKQLAVEGTGIVTCIRFCSISWPLNPDLCPNATIGAYDAAARYAHYDQEAICRWGFLIQPIPNSAGESPSTLPMRVRTNYGLQASRSTYLIQPHVTEQRYPHSNRKRKIANMTTCYTGELHKYIQPASQG